MAWIGYGHEVGGAEISLLTDVCYAADLVPLRDLSRYVGYTRKMGRHEGLFC